MNLRVKLLVGVALLALLILIVADWGKVEPFPLRDFPCQFQNAGCWDVLYYGLEEDYEQ